MIKLLPCPICGKEVKTCMGDPYFMEPYSILCDCGLHFSCKTVQYDVFAKKWNARKNKLTAIEKAKKAKKATFGIIRNLNDRKGLHTDDLDDEIQEEIKEDFINIIIKAFK